MKTMVPLLLALIVGLAWNGAAQAEGEEGPPTRQEVERLMGRRSEGDLVRGQLDTVGFVVTREQAEDVLAAARRAEAGSLAREPAGLLAAVCPHDDHLYAARVYVHVTEHITAPRVLLLGVFHKARLWHLHDRLVFDRFTAWHGPWGPVMVDGLREELLAALPAGDVVVDDTMHCREHSLEAIVPFLQGHRRDVTIVPVLVPYMSWNRMEELARDLSGALAGILRRHGWKLGKDVAVVISSDAVHYGEDFEHAPFGHDEEAYREAVARDRELVSQYIAGPLQSTRLHGLLDHLVDPQNVETYRIPWCGRFSVPFGLETVRLTASALGMPVPEARLLRYGTSLSEPELPVSAATREEGLGYTAPSNLHHWVGYAAIGVVAGAGTGARSVPRE